MIQVRRFDAPRSGDARFAPGELVFHRRYRYRGVVVDSDPVCQAAEDWYQSNQTQPDRDQPWYHVLVDGSAHTTYVAESNLMPDPTAEPITHPLVDEYFDGFQEGHYLRNARPYAG